MADRLFVTKYFSDGVRPHIERGCFQFGSLKKYRAQEQGAEHARFQDTREGIADHLFQPLGGHITHAMIGGNLFIDCVIEGGGALIQGAKQANDLVFCASIGGYDRTHHEQMIIGTIAQDGTPYPGNSDLNNFAVIDLEQFIQATKTLAPTLPVWTTKDDVNDCVLCKEITYGERVNRIDNSTTYFDSGKLTDRDYELALFVKPPMFSPEREIRVAIRPKSPFFLPDSIMYIHLEGKALIDSIVQVGSI